MGLSNITVIHVGLSEPADTTPEPHKGSLESTETTTDVRVSYQPQSKTRGIGGQGPGSV